DGVGAGAAGDLAGGRGEAGLPGFGQSAARGDRRLHGDDAPLDALGEVLPHRGDVVRAPELERLARVPVPAACDVGQDLAHVVPLLLGERDGAHRVERSLAPRGTGSRGRTRRGMRPRPGYGCVERVEAWVTKRRAGHGDDVTMPSPAFGGP